MSATGEAIESYRVVLTAAEARALLLLCERLTPALVRNVASDESECEVMASALGELRGALFINRVQGS